MNMVAVGNIGLICHALNHAEPLLQTFGKLIGGAFKRGSIEAEADGGFCFPALAGCVHIFHHFQREGRCAGVCMGFSGHIAHTFTQSRIAQRDGRVAAIQ